MPTEDLKCVGIGGTMKSAKQDAARKMLYVVMSNYFDRFMGEIDPVRADMKPLLQDDSHMSAPSPAQFLHDN